MQKKHAFSPNHKVVTESKHNFHPNGTPTTASQGQPPQSVGGGGGEQPGGDSEGASGGMDGMNFCNGGMKYADGGNVFDRAGEAVSRVIPGGGNDYNPNPDGHKTSSAEPVTPLAAGDKDEPYAGKGGAQQTKTNMSIADSES